VVQSVERAFAVLGVVGAGPIGLTPIATRVGLPKSTVSRMLDTLEGVGAVERLDGPRWRIAPGLASLASGVAPERTLVAVARQSLVELVRDLGEAAGLALPDGYEVRYVDQVESSNPVQVRDWTGTRAPMHAVPSGLVLLAWWPEAALEAYLERDLARLTPRTVVRPRVVRRRLADVRERGYAWGLEEFAEGINSVAAPLRDGSGQTIAALHVHGPAYRFPPPGGAERIAARVVAAASAVRPSPFAERSH
jgi:DNA-binding IclR family transcriptional regulator